jgi:hypothetical protein
MRLTCPKVIQQIGKLKTGWSTGLNDSYTSGPRNPAAVLDAATRKSSNRPPGNDAQPGIRMGEGTINY